MEFEGKVWKDGKVWLVEVPTLNLMTQGKSRKNALEMIRDASMGLIECYFESKVENHFEININCRTKEVFQIISNQNDLLLALSKRRCSK